MIGVMQNSPTLKAISDFMENRNVDVVQFETTVKVGLQGATNIDSSASYEDTYKTLSDTLDNDQTHYVVSYEDYGLQ
jgi:hypothetical protein